MTIIEKIFLGRQLPANSQVYKYAMLRAYFYAIISLIAAYYLAFDTFSEIDAFIPFYFGMMLISVIGIIINRLGFYTIANAFLVVVSNLIIFILADSDNLNSGLFFYFIAASLTSLILFGYESRLIGLLCVLVSVSLGVFAFVYDFHILASPAFDGANVKASFISNFIVSCIGCSFIIYFSIKQNHLWEKKLESSRKQFEFAIKGAKAGVYEWDLHNNSIFVSSYCEELLGYREGELTPLTVERYVFLLHPKDVEAATRRFSGVLKTHEQYQGEVRLLTKSGTYKWFLDSGLVRVEGDKRFVVGSLIDIDERKRAEQETAEKSILLMKTNEELDRFVYSASHDMRAPLNSLLGLVNLAELSDETKELKLYLSMMKERIKVMEGFIKEVTDYSRNARSEVVLKSHFVAKIVNEVLENLSFYEAAQHINLILKIDPELVVNTDSSRLKVILNNLVYNAYKYYNKDIESPFIAITAQSLDGIVKIEIEDNGIGIDDEHHQKIFNMFYRATENSEGSGLGLYIVKETLEKIGGTISVSSVKGKGSIFSVMLGQPSITLISPL